LDGYVGPVHDLRAVACPQRAVSISPSAIDELGPGQFDRLITQALDVQPQIQPWGWPPTGRSPTDRRGKRVTIPTWAYYSGRAADCRLFELSRDV